MAKHSKEESFSDLLRTTQHSLNRSARNITVGSLAFWFVPYWMMPTPKNTYSVLFAGNAWLWLQAIPTMMFALTGFQWWHAIVLGSIIFATTALMSYVRPRTIGGAVSARWWLVTISMFALSLLVLFAFVDAQQPQSVR